MLPARSLTLNLRLLLLVSVAPVQVMVVPPTMVLMLVQVVPPSVEPYRMSVVASAPLRVAVMVCAAVWVIKSPAVPVSALKTVPLTVCAGAVVSTKKPALSVTALCVRTALLPAASVMVPVLSVSEFRSMLMPLGSVWLVCMV